MKSVRYTGKIVLGVMALLVMIFDSAAALQGASQGIDLCIKSVIPSLFPFLVLSAYLTGNLSGIRIPFLQALGRLCRIPAGSEGILLTGLLGGYPTGAQAISRTCHSGMLSAEDARRMLGFCNNAGPAFLFGVLTASFSKKATVAVLWVIHVLSAIIVGMLLPGSPVKSSSVPNHSKVSLTDALHGAVRSMALICGWVVLFRIICLFLERWILWAVPDTLGILITGSLELVNGCVRLGEIEPESLRFCFANLFINAGGLCVGMQTASVTGDLGTGQYFPGKALQCAVSMALCGLTVPLLFPGDSLPQLLPLGATIIILWLFFAGKRENNSSIFQWKGV